MVPLSGVPGPSVGGRGPRALRTAGRPSRPDYRGADGRRRGPARPGVSSGDRRGLRHRHSGRRPSATARGDAAADGGRRLRRDLPARAELRHAARREPHGRLAGGRRLGSPARPARAVLPQLLGRRPGDAQPQHQRHAAHRHRIGHLVGARGHLLGVQLRVAVLLQLAARVVGDGPDRGDGAGHRVDGLPRRALPARRDGLVGPPVGHVAAIRERHLEAPRVGHRKPCLRGLGRGVQPSPAGHPQGPAGRRRSLGVHGGHAGAGDGRHLLGDRQTDGTRRRLVTLDRIVPRVQRGLRAVPDGRARAEQRRRHADRTRAPVRACAADPDGRPRDRSGQG